MTYFIYSLWHDGTPFYVGKSTSPGDRYWQHCFNSQKGGNVNKFIQSVGKQNIFMKIEERITTLVNPDYVLTAESAWIGHYRKQGFNLLNVHCRKFDPKHHFLTKDKTTP